MLLLDQFKPIRLFVFDVDGVLTDGTILIAGEGDYARRMNVKDGYALQLARKSGYAIMIISGSDAPAVEERMRKLGINDVYMKVTDKLTYMADYIKANGYDQSQVLFMGDDMPDIEAMKYAGIACCPADAVPEVKAIARYISPFKGGDTCVRDVIEKVMKQNHHWQHIEDIASR
ncbi:MAG: 3-deoxy-D-manno-octulosonate 8-phosphate phosphatase [Chitinophagaceae bacterium]|nr:MAG: 3-deoxy-D-manno-octulosonate 8-phosphate phosphatase [Chitinophagaceae bacterium]